MQPRWQGACMTYVCEGWRSFFVCDLCGAADLLISPPKFCVSHFRESESVMHNSRWSFLFVCGFVCLWLFVVVCGCVHLLLFWLFGGCGCLWSFLVVCGCGRLWSLWLCGGCGCFVCVVCWCGCVFLGWCLFWLSCWRW